MRCRDSVLAKESASYLSFVISKRDCLSFLLLLSLGLPEYGRSDNGAFSGSHVRAGLLVAYSFRGLLASDAVESSYLDRVRLLRS